MSAISQEALPTRFNMAGALALLHSDSPFRNPNLACNVLGDFVNRALSRRCRLEEVGIPLAEACSESWDRYFERHNGASDRSFYRESEQGELFLGPRALEFLRDRLKGMRGYSLL